MTQVISAEYICVGSPTLNKNMLPSVAAFLTYLKGLAPKNRKAFAFGSFGWGCMSVKQIEQCFADAGFETVDRFQCKYIPGEDALKDIKDKVKEKVSP